MSMKNKLMLAGASLAAALTLGTTVTTAHAATYDEMNAKWNQKMEEDNKKGLVNAPWLDLQSAADQGDPEAQAWMKQVDGKTSTQSQPSQQTTNTPSQVTSSNNSSSTASVTGNKAAQNSQNTQQPAVNNASSTTQATQSNGVTSSNSAAKSANDMQTLPQTGNDQVQATVATGLGIATLAGMFGLGYLKKRA